MSHSTHKVHFEDKKDDLEPRG